MADRDERLGPRGRTILGALGAALLSMLASRGHAQDARSSEPSYADASTPAPRLQIAGETYGAASVIVHTGEHAVRSGTVELAPMSVDRVPVTLPVATLWVGTRGERPHRLRLALDANDELEIVTVSRDDGRLSGLVTLALGGALSLGASLAVGLTATCRPSFGGADCARPIGAAIVGSIAGVTALAAGFVLLGQPDAIHVDVRGARGLRRMRPHGRGFTLAPAILLGVHGVSLIGVLPFIFLEEPGRAPEPWNALIPGMAAMVAAPLLVSLGGELGGGHGSVWAALIGSLAGWLGMTLVHVAVEEATSSRTGLPAAIVGSTLAVAGSAIGYAISDHDDTQLEGEGLVPLIAIGPDGGSVSVLGAL